MARTERTRLDQALVNRGLVKSRSLAQVLILAGDVLVDGAKALHASSNVTPDQVLVLRQKPRFVSRGGEKLAHALCQFGVNAQGRVCCDLGASTGGFTDCLLQGGASRVYAVDVGYGQLDLRVRQDDRVTVLDRTNARNLEELPELVSLVTADLSFISLKLILPVVSRLLVPGGEFVPLIKPQFEAGRADVGKGGVVKDPAVHRRVLQEVLNACAEAGFTVLGLVESPLRGPAGNIEFLAHLVREPWDSPATANLETLVAMVVE